MAKLVVLQLSWSQSQGLVTECSLQVDSPLIIPATPLKWQQSAVRVLDLSALALLWTQHKKNVTIVQRNHVKLYCLIIAQTFLASAVAGIAAGVVVAFLVIAVLIAIVIIVLLM